MATRLMGPSCQSCGMPIKDPNDFGTTTSGAKKIDYCRFCYQNGQFTEPNLTLEQMIEKCTNIAVTKRKLTPEQAKEVVTDYVSKLKRWRVKLH